MVDSLTKKGMCYSSVVQVTKERVNTSLEGSIPSHIEVVSSVQKQGKMIERILNTKP
jgi:hypothetical protein